MQYLTLGLARSKEKESQQLSDNIKDCIDRKETYILRHENGVPNYTIANCCRPIPGDDVLGIVSADKCSVIVHKQECPEAMKLKSSFGSNIVSTIWQADESQSFPVTIEVRGIDRKGMLYDITQVITTELNINMRSVSIEADNGVFVGRINIYVHDTHVVEHLCSVVKKIKGVQTVVRINE